MTEITKAAIACSSIILLVNIALVMAIMMPATQP